MVDFIFLALPQLRIHGFVRGSMLGNVVWGLFSMGVSLGMVLGYLWEWSWWFVFCLVSGTF